ncbi:MAG: transcriptional regulator FtrA [Pseudomonadota bacterium]
MRRVNDGPLVCVLAYNGLCTFEFGVGVELFGLPRPEFQRWYRFRTVAAEAGPLRGLGGVSILADKALDGLDAADLVLIPGWRGCDADAPEELIAALRAAHAKGARLASICSGAFVLGAAGLLDHRRATTHWRYAERLAAKHPTADVLPDVLYVDDGDVLTSAGSAAGIDLCLHIVRKDFGAEYANAVARRLVLPTHRDGGQRQFVQAPVPRVRGGRIGPLLDRIREQLDEPWPIKRMAADTGMSTRTFARRFSEATGRTPLAWLTATRVSRAAALLESSNSPLADIAMSSGFGSLETFRREFRSARGVSPSRHRAQFGASRAP